MILQSAVPGSSDGVGDAEEVDVSTGVAVPEDVGEPDRTILEAEEVLVVDELVVDGQDSTPMSPWKVTEQPELPLAEEVDVDEVVVDDDLVVDGQDSTPMSPWKAIEQPELPLVGEAEVVSVVDDVVSADVDGTVEGEDDEVIRGVEVGDPSEPEDEVEGVQVM